MTEPEHEGSKLAISADISHLIELARPLEEAANERGIFNVFDDGGYRTLLLVTMFGLTKPRGRLGDDAMDRFGKSFELKTINLITTTGTERTSYPGVTTEHTLRLKNLARYRATSIWLIGVFRGNVPLEIWELRSALLKPYYAYWESKIAASRGGEINNPKIPFAFVAEKGIRHVVAGTEHIPRPKLGRYRELSSTP